MKRPAPKETDAEQPVPRRKQPDGAHDPLVSDIGQRARGLRTRRGWTLQDLSAHTGLSTGMLSQIERGLSSPSIRTLQQLAKAFQCPVGWFFDDGTPLHGAHPDWVLRPENRRILMLRDRGIRKELLSPEGDADIELLMVVVEPGGSSGPQPYSHAGQEAGVVIEGHVNMELDGKTVLLRAGDSFRFDSTLDHRFENLGTAPCTIIWAVTPPLY